MSSRTLAFYYKRIIAEMPASINTIAEIEAYGSNAWREALIAQELMIANTINNDIKNGKNVSQKDIDWVKCVLRSQECEKNPKNKMKPAKNKN